MFANCNPLHNVSSRDEHVPVEKFSPKKEVDYRGQQMRLDVLQSHLKERYCGEVAVEFEHLHDETQRQWIIDAMEGEWHDLPDSDLLTAVSLMRESEILDTFLHTKFRQLKRYSLEGSEASLVATWAMLDESAQVCSVRIVSEYHG